MMTKMRESRRTTEPQLRKVQRSTSERKLEVHNRGNQTQSVLSGRHALTRGRNGNGFDAGKRGPRSSVRDGGK